MRPSEFTSIVQFALRRVALARRTMAGFTRCHITSWQIVRSALAGVAIAASATSARAQDDGLPKAALAIAAYENSKEQCYYEPIVGPTLEKIDEFLSRSRPDEWEEAKLRVEGTDTTLNNLAQSFGAKNACTAPGLAVGDGLVFGIMITGFDPTLMQAVERLSANAGGRLKDNPDAAGNNVMTCMFRYWDVLRRSKLSSDEEMKLVLDFGAGSMTADGVSLKVEMPPINGETVMAIKVSDILATRFNAEEISGMGISEIALGAILSKKSVIVGDFGDDAAPKLQIFCK